MSDLLRAITGEVGPDYGLFTVTESIDGRLVGWPDPPDDRVTAGDDGLAIRADRTGGTVHVRFERWDGPAPVDGWEELWTGWLRSESGLLGVAGWEHEDRHHVEFDLGQSDATWSARVATRILRTAPEDGFPDAFAEVELYKIQLWR
ncbi:hypothetical protein [Planobispora takensis]|uniref:Uncharacterized protein n=1 Tax=Planobispora takensis TaxID=1367882 RepID=A0A8J3T613_9ACTN|nr:hypothetical protein [Planobispora takensis]GII04833.1 hypothetical protein Pta02_68410 [Planobispora takensis]